MATIEVEVDIDDILWEMSDSEKEDLCRELIEDGYGPEHEDVGLVGILNAETYTERELISLLEDLWTNRINIDYKLVDELRAQLRDRNII
jgi:hypothetical protein